MAPRREILDSEDDGSDFGDGPLFGDEDGMPRDDTEAAHETIIDASHNASTDSTDPSFFQRIYDQQHAAADMHDAIPDTAPAAPAVSTWTEVSSAPPPGQKPKEPSSLTSITDPTPASRKSKRTREVSQAEIIDLTDLTTPRKEPASGTSDVWDVPTSTRSQRSSRTYGKRKMAQLSLEQDLPTDNTMPDTQDPYAFPESSPPARTKRAKRGAPSSSAAQQSPPDSSPVMLVHLPAEEQPQPPTSSDRRTRSNGRKKKGGSGASTESTLPDTAQPSLYVAQSTLTANQKREYRVVSLSPQDVLEGVEAFLPGESMGTGEVYKSSAGTATTIAYPTPSRIGSSRRLGHVSEEVEGGGCIDGESLGYDVGYQQSSPDVLTDMTTGDTASAKRSRRKIASSGGLGSSELEPPPSTRRTKRRKVVPKAEDDPWKLQPSEGIREDADGPKDNAHDEGETGEGIHDTAQPETEDVPEPVPNIEPVGVEPPEMPMETPKPAKGKRGRKKKGAKSQERVLDHDDPPNEPAPAEALPEPAAESTEAPEPPAKRKRGRPRKSEAAKPQPETIDEQPPEQQHTEEAQPQFEAEEAPQPLSEVSHNSQPGPSAPAKEGDDADDRDSKENDAPANNVEVDEKPKEKEKEKEKSVVKDLKPSVQKVQYRVGLSKRSRIAPLLKCLQKPS